jgi:hypothetical protein
MMLRSSMSPDLRKHPDLFTPEEAAEYLHLDPETGKRTLETLREKHGLVGQQMGKGFMYHRRNLDEVVNRVFGVMAKISGRRGVA